MVFRGKSLLVRGKIDQKRWFLDPSTRSFMPRDIPVSSWPLSLEAQRERCLLVFCLGMGGWKSPRTSSWKIWAFAEVVHFWRRFSSRSTPSLSTKQPQKKRLPRFLVAQLRWCLPSWSSVPCTCCFETAGAPEGPWKFKEQQRSQEFGGVSRLTGGDVVVSRRDQVGRGKRG